MVILIKEINFQQKVKTFIKKGMYLWLMNKLLKKDWYYFMNILINKEIWLDSSLIGVESLVYKVNETNFYQNIYIEKMWFIIVQRLFLNRKLF